MIVEQVPVLKADRHRQLLIWANSKGSDLSDLEKLDATEAFALKIVRAAQVPNLALQTIQLIAAVSHQLALSEPWGHEKQYDLETIFLTRGFDLYGHLSSLCEILLRRNTELSEKFFAVLKPFSLAVEVDPLSFLGAFMALNLNKLEDAILLADITVNQNPDVLAIQGQALLELGDSRQAAKLLVAAYRMRPNDDMIGFLLSRSLLVSNECKDAWLILKGLEERLPSHPEVITYLGLVAVQINSPDYANRIFGKLFHISHEHAQEKDMLDLCLDVFTVMSDEAVAVQALKCLEDLSVPARKIKDSNFLIHFLKPSMQKNWQIVHRIVLEFCRFEATA